MDLVLLREVAVKVVMVFLLLHRVLLSSQIKLLIRYINLVWGGRRSASSLIFAMSRGSTKSIGIFSILVWCSSTMCLRSMKIHLQLFWSIAKASILMKGQHSFSVPGGHVVTDCRFFRLKRSKFIPEKDARMVLLQVCCSDVLFLFCV